MQTKNETLVIRKVRVDQWSGLAEAAKRLGRTATQVKRHVDGITPSKKLQADMDRLGVVVTKE